MSQLTSNKLPPITVTIYDVPAQRDLFAIGPRESDEHYTIKDVSSFNYFESIYEPFIKARISILDSSGVLEDAFGGCGLRKFCAVTVILASPAVIKKRNGTEIESLDFTGSNCFYVDRIVNQYSKGKKQIYELELINKNAIISFTKHVSRKWPPGKNSTNIEWNKIIEDLLTDEMKVDTSKQKEIKIDKTEQIDVYPALNYTPLTIINDACSRAIPLSQSGGVTVEENQSKSKGALPQEKNKKPAGYAFFETYDKYNYISLDSLVNIKSQTTVDDYHIFAERVANSNNSNPLEESQTIISKSFYDDGQTAGAVEDVLTGKTGNKELNYFDMGTRKFKVIDYSYPTEPCESIPFEGGFKMKTYKVTTTYSLEYIDTCDRKDLEKLPENDSLSTLNYAGNLEDIRSKTSTIRVPGNLSLSAGDKVSLSFLKIEGDKGESQKYSDKYSGIYVITELSHTLEGVNKLYTDLNVCKLKDK